jgi:hypothetical protein
MASLLHLKEEDTLFEPAAGDGHLIDAALAIQPSVSVTAYELHPDHAENLRKKYRDNGRIEIFERDTIFCSDLELRENFGPRFSKILANPPYGGWQEYKRRAELKKRFRGFYVRETYTLFLLRCLKLLEKDGILVFIIPDTFLYLHLHTRIRKYILENYTVESIDVFKSALFPGIAFGYAGLCIVAIRASSAASLHSFRLRFVDSLSHFQSPSHLEATSSLILQKDLLRAHSFTIPVSPNQAILEESSGYGLTMADVADCVTGFYSGQDKIFLRRASANVKRSNGYDTVEPGVVEDHPFSKPSLLDGIEGKRCFIPILKGGGYNFIKPIQWYVDWGATAVAHYKRDAKARFQNASYYFKPGIGFPMVTSTRPTAALIDDCLFDQSIVGIFPKGTVSLEFLLAYCNSMPFWACLKAINPSANNSARYVLRTPIILPDSELEETISMKTRELLQELKTGGTSASTLRREILRSITEYVKRKASYKALEPTALRAVAQV